MMILGSSTIITPDQARRAARQNSFGGQARRRPCRRAKEAAQDTEIS